MLPSLCVPGVQCRRVLASGSDAAWTQSVCPYNIGCRGPFLQVGIIDFLIIGVYFVFLLGIGFSLKKQMVSSEDFFLSGRSIPSWITGLAFISANLGAIEVMGMAGLGAEYGAMSRAPHRLRTDMSC